jgi:hypothetical protein
MRPWSEILRDNLRTLRLGRRVIDATMVVFVLVFGVGTALWVLEVL